MEKMQEAFIRAIDNGHLSHAYLFEGAKGIGKAEMAKEIAKMLNCTKRKKASLHAESVNTAQELTMETSRILSW